MNQEETESPKRLVTISEIEAVIKKLLAHKSPGPHGFTGEFYQIFKEQLTPILVKPFQKFPEEERLPNCLYEAGIILIPKPDKDTREKKTIGQ